MIRSQQRSCLLWLLLFPQLLLRYFGPRQTKFRSPPVLGLLHDGTWTISFLVVLSLIVEANSLTLLRGSGLPW